jgi:hypothetical protein
MTPQENFNLDVIRDQWKAFRELPHRQKIDVQYYAVASVLVVATLLVALAIARKPAPEPEQGYTADQRFVLQALSSSAGKK